VTASRCNDVVGDERSFACRWQELLACLGLREQRSCRPTHAPHRDPFPCRLITTDGSIVSPVTATSERSMRLDHGNVSAIPASSCRRVASFVKVRNQRPVHPSNEKQPIRQAPAFSRGDVPGSMAQVGMGAALPRFCGGELFV
jgi:hypothetical protein